MPVAGGGGVDNFLDLSDTPNTYTGESLKLVRVNAGETALEFVASPTTSPGGSDTQVQINDGGVFGGDAGFAYNKTTDLLTVSSKALISGDGGGLYLGTVGTGAETTNIFYGANASVGTLWMRQKYTYSSSDIVFERSSDGGTSWSNIMTLDWSDSRVGIGTVAPGAKLDVVGDVRASTQLISTVVTGTAPLVVSSTTKVTNLNADTLDGLDSTAFQPIDATLTSIAAVAGVQGDLLYADASDTWTRLAKNASSTRYLSNTGTSNNPAWAQVNVTNGITGAVPIANGGTGQTTATAAFNALDPLTTKGDLVAHDGTNSVRQAIGTNTQVLTADSTETNGMKWAAAPAATVNDILMVQVFS